MPASRRGSATASSYVMVQNDIRFVFTAPLTDTGELAEHVRRHGDGVHDIAFAVDDVASAWRETTARGAVSALEPTEVTGEKGVLRRSAIHTYGEVLHSFIDRSDYHGTFAPGYHRIAKPAGRGHRTAAARGRPLRRQRGAGRHEPVRRLLPRRARLLRS